MSAEPRSISAAVARRFLVIRHLLVPPRSLPAEPGSVMRVVDRLGSLQFDPIDVVGRNHDLTLLARIDGYRRTWTDELLYRDRALYETYNKMLSLVPTAELPWYRITWDRHHEAHRGGAFDDHAPLVAELLERIRTGGPLSSTDIEPREAIDWYWRPTNQVRALLEALAEAGLIAISRREGNRRVYDLTERLFPAELLARQVPADEQLRHKLLSRYRGNGLLGATGEYTLWMGLGKAPERRRVHQELVEAGAITPVAVEGLRGSRFVVTDELPMLDAAEAEVTLEAGIDGPARPGGCEPGRGLPRAAGPARVGSRPARAAVRVRVPLGGLRARAEATLGLLRAPAAVRRPVRRPHRAARGPGVGHAAGGGPVVGGGVRSRSPRPTRDSPRPSPPRCARTPTSRGLRRWRCRERRGTGRSRARFASGCRGVRRSAPRGPVAARSAASRRPVDARFRCPLPSRRRRSDARHVQFAAGAREMHRGAGPPKPAVPVPSEPPDVVTRRARASRFRDSALERCCHLPTPRAQVTTPRDECPPGGDLAKRSPADDT